MDLRQLDVLVAVAETGSFSAAADLLHTVQSNVSAHVARLERELGVALVDRAAGRLTEEGEAVVARARRVHAELEGLVADVAAVSREVSGTVRLGIFGSVGRWLVPRLVDELGRRHPQVRLAVVEGTTTSVEPQLLTGRLDLALMNLPVDQPELATEDLFEEDLVLIVEREHPLADRDTISFPELNGMDLMLPPPRAAYREDIDVACRAAGVTIRPVLEIDGVRLLASLTFEGYGHAVVPAGVLPALLQDRFRAVSIEGLPRRRVGVALRRMALPAAPARALFAILHDVVADDSGRPHGVYPLPRSGVSPGGKPRRGGPPRPGGARRG